jgi:hypothetical protein
MKLFLLFLFFTGVIMIMVNQLIVSNKTKVEYKYLQRDLDTYLREEAAEIPGSFKDAPRNPGYAPEFNQDTWLSQQGALQKSKVA